MYIYDSAKRRKVPFEPIYSGEVSIYVCGPTVYDNAHLGHARSSLSFDILGRTLRALGYSVRLCKNFTDIDDKIIKKIRDTDETLENITEYYIRRYLDDMRALGVIDADIMPRATESLGAITDMVQRLIDRNIAYLIDSGDVYFDTSKDEKYGTISQQVGEEEDSRSRVIHVKQKRNLKDFALWKRCVGDDDICYDTPFGRGRPGWHIECSAMIDKHFRGDERYNIDIHGGGADLLFPHHENEASQSRCASNRELAKYWMHNGFVNIDGEKMSKSLGNSFFVKDALEVYDGEVLRNYLISVHYRNDFNFNEEDLLNSKKRLDKLYRLKKRVLPIKPSKVNRGFRDSLLEAMGDDLNISVALSHIDEMINDGNDRLDMDSKNRGVKREILANIEFIEILLGIGGREPSDYFQIGVDEVTKEKIESLIAKRYQAKKEKDYTKADRIREELVSMGINIMDTADGTIWERSF